MERNPSKKARSAATVKEERESEEYDARYSPYPDEKERQERQRIFDSEETGGYDRQTGKRCAVEEWDFGDRPINPLGNYTRIPNGAFSDLRPTITMESIRLLNVDRAVRLAKEKEIQYLVRKQSNILAQQFEELHHENKVNSKNRTTISFP